MFGINKRFSKMGKTSKEVDPVINEAIGKQKEIKKSWSSRRPTTLAVSNPKSAEEKVEKTNKEPIAVLPKTQSSIFNDDSKRNGILSYWFPLMCAAAVVSVALWTFWPTSKNLDETVAQNNVPAPVVRPVEPAAQPATQPAPQPAAESRPAAIATALPSFDIVRIESNGNVVIAGRARANEQVSVQINGRIVATVAANRDGEFVHAPKTRMRPGNYTLQLIAGSNRSDRVFLYIDERPEQSLSLLMTKDTSRVLQAPTPVRDGAFVVNRIDYLENGRLVIQGKGLPRLRVSATLNDRSLGMTRVSSHKNFGLGANVGQLAVGDNFRLNIRMHDAQNNSVAQITHEFTMPAMTGNADTFYVVRRGDSLWVISRNFKGTGFQFTAIAAANNIENPDLILPDQRLRIPVRARR